jgi:DNA-binding PadR family transcriptional regulator
MIEFVVESDPLIAKVKPKRLINYPILKKLDDSGFIDQVWKRN